MAVSTYKRNEHNHNKSTAKLEPVDKYRFIGNSCIPMVNVHI